MKIPYEEWVEKGRRLYGDDPREWRFRCAVCGHVQSVASVQHRHAALSERGESHERSIMAWIHYSCEGRLDDKPRSAFYDAPDAESGCDYTIGGLFNLAPIYAVQSLGGILCARCGGTGRAEVPGRRWRARCDACGGSGFLRPGDLEPCAADCDYRCRRDRPDRHKPRTGPAHGAEAAAEAVRAGASATPGAENGRSRNGGQTEG